MSATGHDFGGVVCSANHGKVGQCEWCNACQRWIPAPERGRKCAARRPAPVEEEATDE